MKYDVTIIGAGAAGLIAARELLDAGFTVCIVEASSTPGGRIATITKKEFEQPLETGAEFVHGKLPLTLKLLEEYQIPYHAIEGKMIGVRKGRWSYEEEHEAHWDELMHRMKKQKEDLTIANFLQEHFSEKKYEGLRNAVKSFCRGI
jgi:monoamine oxidase